VALEVLEARKRAVAGPADVWPWLVGFWGREVGGGLGGAVGGGGWTRNGVSIGDRGVWVSRSGGSVPFSSVDMAAAS
jgi:hypothetical protein